MFSKYINDEHNDWDTFLPFITYAYNTNVNSHTTFSPFEVIYNRPATQFIDATCFKSNHYDNDIRNKDATSNSGEKK
eukprot:Pgem_evm3s12064